MPKLPHEALVQLIRNAPALIVELLQPQTARAPLPTPLRVTAAEFVDLNFAEHRADAVLLLGDDTERPDEALVVEAQGEPDPRKRRTWPLYVAGMGVRHGCPVTLVIVAPDPEVAAWCARPIDLGRERFVLHPLVIGPQQIPVITDLDAARRSPELAVLSVAAHGHEPGAEHIALAALAASRGLDSDRELLYPDFIFVLLGEVARAALEQLMQTGKYEYQSDFVRKHYFQGKAEGKAELLLKLLRLRGFIVDAALEARVHACHDAAQIDAWAEQVLSATSLADVFAATPAGPG